MIPRDGVLPGKQQLEKSLKEVEETYEHTYQAEPQALTGFAGQPNEPPFTTGPGLVPKVAGQPIPSPRPGIQPVYHVKVTARPVKNLQPGKKLTYTITGGQTEAVGSGKTVKQIIGPAGSTIHCIPELADAAPAGESAAGTSPMESPKSSKHSSYHDQLSGISGLEDASIGALVHAYKGQHALKTETVMSGLLSSLNAVRSQSMVSAPPPSSPAAARVPSAAAAVDSHIPQDIAQMRAGSMKRENPSPAAHHWWDANSNSLDAVSAAEQERMAQEYKAMTDFRELKYGKQSTLVQQEEAKQPPVGEGFNNSAFTVKGGQPYSKVIPGLVDSNDEEKHTVYNWIVPDENAADAFAHLDSAMSVGLTEQHLNQVPFQRGNTANIMRLMNRTRDEAVGEQPAKRGFSLKNLLGFGRSDAVTEPRKGGSTRDANGASSSSPRSSASPPLHFQDSAQLAEFLNKANEGLIWEQRGDPMAELRAEARSRRSSAGHPSVKTGDQKFTDSAGNDLTEGGCCEGENSEEESQISEEPPLRPSIVYGGVEHDAPRYAGELGPLTMRLHATEIHQYVKVAGMPEPWIMTSKADPAHHAIHGPVALPWDPKYTGMPAPTLNDVKRHNCATIDLPPTVTQWFDPELPADYIAGQETGATAAAV